MGKEVTLKNYELITISQSMGEFMQLSLPVNIGWNLKKNMRKLESALKDFAEAEQELVYKYALKIDDKVQYEDNGQPKIYPANQTIFKTNHTELLNCDNPVDILPIKLSELMGINVKASLLFNLEFMIDDDIEDKPE
jgi:hypothetical protein